MDKKVHLLTTKMIPISCLLENYELRPEKISEKNLAKRPQLRLIDMRSIPTTTASFCLYLASLGIMGPEMRAARNPSDHHNTIILMGLRGALNWASIMPRDIISGLDDIRQFREEGKLFHDNISRVIRPLLEACNAIMT